MVRSLEQHPEQRPLLELLPSLRRIWLRLIDAPTPLRRLDRLETDLGCGDLWIKDDRCSSNLLGGFKTRKLEFLLGEAMARGAHTAITFGATGSSHALATALHARSRVDRTILFLSRQPARPGSVADYNRRRLGATDATSIRTPLFVRLLLERGLLVLAAMPGEGFGRLSIIPTGGSSPIGCLGAVNALLEVGCQFRSMGEAFPAEIIVAGGSSGTAAGLAVGLGLLDVRSRIKMVPVASCLFASLRRVQRLARETQKLLSSHGLSRRASGSIPVDVVHGFQGPGYGHTSPEGLSASARLRRLESVGLDDTYTAKAMAAFLVRAASQEQCSSRLLFWNTVGAYPGASSSPHLDGTPGLE